MGAVDDTVGEAKVVVTFKNAVGNRLIGKAKLITFKNWIIRSGRGGEFTPKPIDGAGIITIFGRNAGVDTTPKIFGLTHDGYFLVGIGGIEGRVPNTIHKTTTPNITNEGINGGFMGNKVFGLF